MPRSRERGAEAGAGPSSSALLLGGLLGAAALGGCLFPHYDNHYAGDSGAASDGAGSSDGGPVESGSGKTVAGAMFCQDQDVKAPGPVLHIDGYAQPQFTSMPADNLGNVSLEIPKSALGMPRYLVIDGTYMGKPIVRTWLAPKSILDGGAANNSDIFHFFQNQDDGKGIRGVLAAQLQAHGDIPDAARFTDDYTWMFGVLLLRTDQGPLFYKGYQIRVDSLDNTSCKPAQQCCVYYTHSFSEYLAGQPFVDFTATRSPGWFAVVCPSSQTGDVTLTQTGTMPFDGLGNPPPTPFAPITAPRVKGEATNIHWQPQ